MPLYGSMSAVALLLVWLASLPGCDFRQITEDRPLKLPAESTEPKETHSAQVTKRADPSGPAPTR